MQTAKPQSLAPISLAGRKVRVKVLFIQKSLEKWIQTITGISFAFKALVTIYGEIYSDIT